MRGYWRRFALGIVAAAAVAALSLEGYLPHTDDGCSIETHCAVCAGHIGTTAIVHSAAPLPVPLDAVASLPAHTKAGHLDPALPAPSSRGPPLA